MSDFTRDDLKALAAVLPPSERVMGGEVGDVLSAVVSVITHGPQIIDAAKQGADKVADFLHDELVKLAEAGGHPVPQRGATVATVAPAPAAPSSSDISALEAQIAALTKLVTQSLAGESASGSAAGDTSSSEHA